MGTMSYDAVIISGDYERVQKAREIVIEIAQHIQSRAELTRGEDWTSLVTPVAHGMVNGEASFLIGPDGSKEWWDLSDAGDVFRREVVAQLEASKLWLSVVEVRWGELGDRLVVDGREIVNVPD